MNGSNAPAEVQEVRQSFIYTTNWIALPTVVGNSSQTTLAILADADFECVYITAAVRQGNVIVLTWAGLVQISDSGAGRTMFNAPLPFDAINGNGRQPYPLLPPRRFRSNSSIVITFTTNVVTAGDAYVAFHGNKLFPVVKQPYQVAE